MRRVASLGDGWLASAYNTTPEDYAAKASLLRQELEKRGRPAENFPGALVTMWAWVTDKRAEADRLLSENPWPTPQARGRRSSCSALRRSCGTLRRAAFPLCSSGVPTGPLLDDR